MCSKNIFFNLGFWVGLPQNMGFDFSVCAFSSLRQENCGVVVNSIPENCVRKKSFEVHWTNAGEIMFRVCRPASGLASTSRCHSDVVVPPLKDKRMSCWI